jgi:hypothetical protein
MADTPSKRYELTIQPNGSFTSETPAAEAESATRAAAPTPPMPWNRRAERAASVPVSSVWLWVPVAALILFFVALGFEPAKAQDSETTTTDWIVGGGLLVILSLSYVAGAVSVWKGKRVGLLFTLPSTLLFLALVLSYPLSSHHAGGNWVIGSFGAAFTATALHVGSILATRGAAHRV